MNAFVMGREWGIFISLSQNEGIIYLFTIKLDAVCWLAYLIKNGWTDFIIFLLFRTFGIQVYKDKFQKLAAFSVTNNYETKSGKSASYD